MSLKVGDKVKSFQVTSVINIGVMAISYFVKEGSKEYFMKEYIDPKESHPKFQEFFDNQVIIINRLNEMGSITEKYIDHFVLDGIYYQIKEKLNGINIEEYYKSHTEYSDRLQLSIVLCGILKNLHSKNIVHQDLKPAQIMLVDDEIGKKTKLGYRLILSDFDWAIPDKKIVQIVGTIMYESPEHYRNQTPSKKSDIFTLGIMIYEFLTGRNPYDFDDIIEDPIIKERVLNKKIFSDPMKLNSDINENINNIILKCLEPDSSKRPEIHEIQEILIGREKLTTIVNASINKFTLKSDKGNYIISSTTEMNRAIFKTFFKDNLDENGNSIYKYCDESNPMLIFTKESDGKFFVSKPNPTKNYFLLNNTKIEKEKIEIRKGDKLNLYSSSLSKVIISFDLI